MVDHTIVTLLIALITGNLFAANCDDLPQVVDDDVTLPRHSSSDADSVITFPRNCDDFRKRHGDVTSGAHALYHQDRYDTLENGFRMRPIYKDCSRRKKRGVSTSSATPVTVPTSINISMARDCADIQTKYFAADKLAPNGIYKIYHPDWYQVGPDGIELTPVYVYCDMRSAGGGWTVFQRRQDGSVNFTRNWHDYEFGFGEVKGEYWLGLRFINTITETRRQVLKIHMRSRSNVWSYAMYQNFSVGNSTSGYKLNIECYQGNDTYGDGLTYHSGAKFSTYDNDQDTYSADNCADTYKGGYWYKTCANSNLNGVYNVTSRLTSIYWGSYSSSYVKNYVTMAVRPEMFGP